MVNQDKLDDIRTIILSLLLARKGATPVPVLERDYYEIEQKRIPYRQFGHSNLVEFLQSMPEHFAVEYYNGVHQVRGIASEKSKHVSSLVARQKIPEHPRRYIPPHLRQPMSNRRIHMKSNRVRISPEKLFCLMQYIKNNPNGVSLQNAVMFVQKLVPYINVSPQDLRDQLRELSHQLCLDGNMIYPAQNNNLQGNVVHQQSLTTNASVPPLWNELESPSNSGSPPITQTVCAAGQEEFEYGECFSDELHFVPAGYTGKCQRRPKTSEQLATNLAQYVKYEQTNTFNNEVKSNIEISEEDYFAMMNSKSNSEMKTFERLGDISEIICDKIKFRLEELLRKHPEGIWCADLPEVYLQEYKVRLNYTGLGFASVREFTSYLPKIFYMTQVNKTDDFILYSADKRPVVPKTEPIDITQSSNNQYDEHRTVQAQCSNDDEDAPIPSEVSPTITKRFAPNDVMNYGDNVDKISVIELKRNKKFLEVYVVEVFHPNFFWIQLRENKKCLYRLMDELTDFYEANKNTYTIAKIALKKDLNCACVYINKWHRGIIKSVKPDFRVTVLFYDYGTLKTYAPEDIYYLHKKFSFLPAQAIPCSLYDVKPSVGDRWKKSVSDRFVEKIADTLLAATIITVDPTYNSMMVILTDTSEEEDVCINDWLVKERLAQVGKMADAVDMASIMKYVVNNLNQIPTYCFAEENLMPENCCKATSTEEKHETPLIPSGPTCVHYDNHHQPVRPPPGFPSFTEQRIPSNGAIPSIRNFQNCYSFANTSNISNTLNTNVSISGDVEATTNPFLADQQFISNDMAKQMYMSIWNENKKLQISIIEILNVLMERLSLSVKDHIQLNKILKIIEKVLLEQKDNHSTKTPSNLANGTTLNDIDSAQKAPYNLNSETVMNQEFNINTFLMSNPFGINSGDKPQSNAMFSTYNGLAFKNNWSQSNEFSPPSTTANPSSFVNSENIPLMMPVAPAMPANTSTSNNFSECLDNLNTQFANMLKDTNPFKTSIIDGTQIPETRNERTANIYDADIASYLLTKNPQSNTLKTETANIHVRSNCFTPVSNVECVSENYTSRIVYESGPVMYNTQKKQADADTDANARQNACSNNFDNIQNSQSVELGQYDKNSASQVQPANDIAASQHIVINHKITKDNSQVDENYITRQAAHYMQDLQSIRNSEATYYQQNGNVDNLRPVSSQAWNQIEIPEYWANSKFQNSVPLLNHNKSTSNQFCTPLSWNRDNGRKSIESRETNEATNSSYVFEVKDNHDKEKPMDTYANSWYNTKNESVQNMNAICSSPFVFQKIDSVKGVTFLFNFEQDGWILTYEFVEAFTNLKLHSCLLATLEILNIKVIFKEILRSEYPLQFLQLDGYPLNVPRDSEKHIISINLISLQTALALLHKLKIVSREEIENAFKRNEFLGDSVLPTLWTLIVTYRDLKRRIELCSNYIYKNI